MSQATLSAVFFGEVVDAETTKQQTREEPVLWRFANAFRIAFVDEAHLAEVLQKIMSENGYPYILSACFECNPKSQSKRRIRPGMEDPATFTAGIVSITFALGGESLQK